jgi:hypothetical protein
LFENHSENSLKPDLSNDTTANPPLFSLVNTFKHRKGHRPKLIFILFLPCSHAKL